MRRILLVALLLAGCNQSAPSDSTNAAMDNGVPATIINTSADTSAEAGPSTTGAPDNLADNLADNATSNAQAAPTPDSAAAAALVVQQYYALIAAGNYADAIKSWDPAPASADAFAAGFGSYAGYHAQIGTPGAIDAGAGQRYVTVPVILSGRLKSGGAYHAKANVTLHRVGDIDGATPEQLSWHIRSIDVVTS